MDISNYEVTLTDVAKEEIENIYAYILENLHERGIICIRLKNMIKKNQKF